MFILTGTSFGPTKMVYNGSGMEYTDRDSNLLPFTDYQYSVTVLNHVGKVSSLWELVTTKESPPDSVPAPAIEVSTQRHKPATFPINCHIPELNWYNQYTGNFAMNHGGIISLLLQSQTMLVLPAQNRFGLNTCNVDFLSQKEIFYNEQVPFCSFPVSFQFSDLFIVHK